MTDTITKAHDAWDSALTAFAKRHGLHKSIAARAFSYTPEAAQLYSDIRTATPRNIQKTARQRILETEGKSD